MRVVAYIADLPAADRITFADRFDPATGAVLPEWQSTAHVQHYVTSASGTYKLVAPSSVPVVAPPVLTPEQEATKLAAANLASSQAAVASATATLESALAASLASGDRTAVVAAETALRRARDLLGVRMMLATSPAEPVRAAAVALEAAYVAGNAAIEAAETTYHDALRLADLRGY